MSIEVFVFPKPGIDKGLLDSLTVGESFVVANRPSVAVDLVRFNT